MLSVTLVATSFGHFDHHQANATQNLKRLVTCSVHKFQVIRDPIYTDVIICQQLCVLLPVISYILDFICGEL
jgi:hypothetical protein